MTSKGLIALMAAVIMLAGASVAGATTYTGSLSIADGGLTGQADWADGVTLAWTVTDEGVCAGCWKYTYTLTVDADDPNMGGVLQGMSASHALIEVSTSFTSADVLTGSSGVAAGDPQTYSAGGSNPDLPGSIFALKFDLPSSDLTESWVVITTRAPVWGDFYAKDGDTDMVTNIVYNTGFLAVDPVAAPHNGAELNHLLVPDTASTVVPEPATLLLVGSGLAGLGYVSRRRRARNTAA